MYRYSFELQVSILQYRMPCKPLCPRSHQFFFYFRTLYSMKGLGLPVMHCNHYFFLQHVVIAPLPIIQPRTQGFPFPRTCVPTDDFAITSIALSII